MDIKLRSSILEITLDFDTEMPRQSNLNKLSGTNSGASVIPVTKIQVSEDTIFHMCRLTNVIPNS